MRTSVGSRSKYSAKPPQTPAIFLLVRGTRQALRSRRRVRWRRVRSRNQAGAAVVAEIGVIGDFFLAIWADHGDPPQVILKA